MTCTKHYSMLIALFFLLSVSVSNATEVEVPTRVVTSEMLSKLTPEQAYQTGKLLQQQMKNGAPYLKYAADKGLAKAARAYAYSQKGNIFIQSSEEAKYRLIAAKLGDVWSMMVMSGGKSHVTEAERKMWGKKALALFHQRASQGDAMAMHGLVLFYNGNNPRLSDSWLEKAAEQGLAVSQYNLARHYEMDGGWFIIPGNREKKIRSLYKAAAEGGYISARLMYMDTLEAEGKLDEAFRFLSLNIDDGDAMSLNIVAAIYLGTEENVIGIAVDKLKGLAYYQMFLRAMGTDTGDQQYRSIVKDRYLKLYNPLMETEKQQVDAIADEYLASHTVRYFDAFWVIDE